VLQAKQQISKPTANTIVAKPPPLKRSASTKSESSDEGYEFDFDDDEDDNKNDVDTGKLLKNNDPIEAGTSSIASRANDIPPQSGEAGVQKIDKNNTDDEDESTVSDESSPDLKVVDPKGKNKDNKIKQTPKPKLDKLLQDNNGRDMPQRPKPIERNINTRDTNTRDTRDTNPRDTANQLLSIKGGAPSRKGGKDASSSDSKDNKPAEAEDELAQKRSMICLINHHASIRSSIYQFINSLDSAKLIIVLTTILNIVD
jgi:hypothetical protein